MSATTIETDTDVLVVGAGPAGSAVATHLAARGREVTLLEAARHPRPKACAEYASPAIPGELARLGLAPADWQATALPLDGMRVITSRESFEIRYADRKGEPMPAWGVDRTTFDALLAARAVAAGAQLADATRLTGLDRDVEWWWASTTAGTIRARWLVGADGARSRVAPLLGVEREVRFPRRLGLIAHYEGHTGLDRSGEMHVGAGGYIGLAPTPGGRLNVGMALPLDGATGSRRRFEEAINAIPAVARHLRGARRISRIRGAAPIGHRVASAAGPGWMLVGDAAGFVDPFTGEGIYRALRSGRAAADALQAESRASGVPDRYLRERRAAFAAKDGLTWLVQAMLAAPALLDYASARLSRRTDERILLGSALGDCLPAHLALSPGFIAGVLRP